MSVEENKAIARRWFEAGISGHNPTVVDEVCAPDFINHDRGAPEGGREGLKQLLAGGLAAMPDLRATIEDMVAEGDTVAVRSTFHGTQTGDLMGIPATGKAVTITGMYILRFAQGKIAEAWVEQDMLGMMQQLGMIPAPGQAPG